MDVLGRVTHIIIINYRKEIYVEDMLAVSLLAVLPKNFSLSKGVHRYVYLVVYWLYHLFLADTGSSRWSPARLGH